MCVCVCRERERESRNRPGFPGKFLFFLGRVGGGKEESRFGLGLGLGLWGRWW